MSFAPFPLASILVLGAHDSQCLNSSHSFYVFSTSQCYVQYVPQLITILGKPQHKKISVHLGIAQISIGPPPRTETGTLWHLFLGKIMPMPVCTCTFLLKIGATNHSGKGLDPPPKKKKKRRKKKKKKTGPMNRYFLMLGLP